MKLETRMSNAAGKWLPSVTWGDPLDASLNHDAAAAHALMLAIGEFHNAPLDSSLTFPKDAIDWLEVRADSIIRSWGFDSGEDA